MFSSCTNNSSSGSRSIVLPTTTQSRKSSSSSSSTTTTTSSGHHHQKFYTAEQRDIMDKCNELYASILPLNEKVGGPLSSSSSSSSSESNSGYNNNHDDHDIRGTSLPFVLLVGNHSSGKSTFINYILGRQIQQSGVAPTDDSFTVIAPGPIDRDQDGPALVGDPDLGFSQLRQFGPTLIHHTHLKIRSNINSNFIIVDSPGMIDAPPPGGGSAGGGGNSASGNSGIGYNPYPDINGQYYAGYSNNSGGSGGGSGMDRGYDFTGVVRWLSDHADVVLLFFDPDKPGTTGETLSVMLHALTGIDHKLFIILNKADQFTKIHDFARAYGSLCWNLSKVIPRKDLPRIYTMYLPVNNNNNNNNNNNGRSDENSTTTSSWDGLSDLHSARDEVINEVRKAPERRMDNILTHLYDCVHRLQMHTIIVRDIQKRYNTLYWKTKFQEITTAFTGLSITTIMTMYSHTATNAVTATDTAATAATTTMITLSLPPYIPAMTFATTILCTGSIYWYNTARLNNFIENCTSSTELGNTFQRTYTKSIQDGDEYIATLWTRIRDGIRITLSTNNKPINEIPTIQQKDITTLYQLINVHIPALRRQTSPKHYGKKT